MALTGHFLDFQEEVGRLRTNMIAEIYAMTSGQSDIHCNVEISELSTDDLVALYEFVFGVRYPEQS